MAMGCYLYVFRAFGIIRGICIQFKGWSNLPIIYPNLKKC